MAERLARWAPLAAALLAVAAHAPALRHPFVYDDLWSIVANPAIHQLTPLRHVLFGGQRPLTQLTLALDWRLGGGAPWAFHLTALLLHALAAALVTRLAARLAEDTGRPLAPLFVGALFAVHPLTVEAVDYAAARAGLLAGTLALGATLLVAAQRPTRARTALGLLLALAAVAAKESGAAVLPLLALHEAWLRPAPWAARRRRLARVHLPLLALIAAGGAWRLALHLRHQGGALPDGAHLRVQAAALLRALELVIAPTGLTIFHELPDPGWLPVVAVGLGLALIAWRGPRWLQLATAWFVLFFLPSALLPLREPFAEHRIYEALPGALLVVGALVAAIGRLPRAPAWLVPAVAVVLVGGAAALTEVRVRVWSSPITLWADAAAKAPAAWTPAYALGDAQRAAGDCGAAVRAYDRAIALTDQDTRAHQNRGICRAQLGDLDGAEADFTAARARAPRDASLVFDLGLVEEKRGHRDAARALYDEALRLDPRNGPALTARARVAPQP